MVVTTFVVYGGLKMVNSNVARTISDVIEREGTILYPLTEETFVVAHARFGWFYCNRHY